MLFCCVIDFILMFVYNTIYNLQIVIHHMIMFILIIFGLFNTPSHHYYSNMAMMSEVVAITTFMSPVIRYYNLHNILFKIYYAIYALLTIFCRGFIWATFINAARNNSNSHYICIVGVIPLILLDIYWTYECIYCILYGSMKYNKKKN